MRLIDADNLADFICDRCGDKDCDRNTTTCIERDFAIACAKEMSTIEVEPVRHGHWKNNTECSVCGEYEDFVDGYRPYCPNCGAKMDGGEE